jgi:hypothetical protein
MASDDVHALAARVELPGGEGFDLNATNTHLFCLSREAMWGGD